MIVTNNKTARSVKRDGRRGVVQMITSTEKLAHLKYELLVAYFDRHIQFLSFTLIKCTNMTLHEIFVSGFKITIRFLRKYVYKMEISFIDIF